MASSTSVTCHILRLPDEILSSILALATDPKGPPWDTDYWTPTGEHIAHRIEILEAVCWSFRRLAQESHFRTYVHIAELHIPFFCETVRPTLDIYNSSMLEKDMFFNNIRSLTIIPHLWKASEVKGVSGKIGELCKNCIALRQVTIDTSRVKADCVDELKDMAKEAAQEALSDDVEMWFSEKLGRP